MEEGALISKNQLIVIVEMTVCDVSSKYISPYETFIVRIDDRWVVLSKYKLLYGSFLGSTKSQKNTQ